MPYFDLQNSLTDDLIKIKMEEAVTILRTIDKSIDGLLSDFTEPGKIYLADFMEKNFMFNLPLENFAQLTGRSIATFNRETCRISSLLRSCQKNVESGQLAGFLLQSALFGWRRRLVFSLLLFSLLVR
jgi:hypothetical protein